MIRKTWEALTSPVSTNMCWTFSPLPLCSSSFCVEDSFSVSGCVSSRHQIGDHQFLQLELISLFLYSNILHLCFRINMLLCILFVFIIYYLFFFTSFTFLRSQIFIIFHICFALKAIGVLCVYWIMTYMYMFLDKKELSSIILSLSLS